jgi:hypothetical protein
VPPVHLISALHDACLQGDHKKPCVRINHNPVHLPRCTTGPAAAYYTVFANFRAFLCAELSPVFGVALARRKTGTSCVYRLRLREQGVSSVMGEACRVCDLLHSESSFAKLGRPTTSWQGRPLIVTNTTPVPGCLCLAYTLLLAIHDHSWGFVSVCIHSVWHTLLLARDSICGLLTQLCCRVCTAIGVSAFAALDQDVQTRDRDPVPVLTCAVLAPDARLLRPFSSVKKGGQSRGYHNLHCSRKPLLVV